MNKTYKNIYEQATDLDAFFDFSTGMNVEDEEIKEWIIQAINSGKKKMIENGLKNCHYNISSGNTMVMALFYRDTIEDDIRVEIYFTKDYKTKSIRTTNKL